MRTTACAVILILLVGATATLPSAAAVHVSSAAFTPDRFNPDNEDIVLHLTVTNEQSSSNHIYRVDILAPAGVRLADLASQPAPPDGWQIDEAQSSIGGEGQDKIVFCIPVRLNILDSIAPDSAATFDVMLADFAPGSGPDDGDIQEWSITTYDDDMSKGGEGSSTAQGASIVADKSPPHFAVLRAGLEFANAGTVVPITFEVTEDLAEDPVVTIRDREGFASVVDGLYTYVFTVAGTDEDGPVGISISGVDLAGNVGTAELTSLLTIDSTAPSFGDLVVTPLAKVGTAVAVTFEATEALAEVPEVTILDRSAEFDMFGGGLYTYTFLVEAGDAEGPVDVSISGVDLAGNVGMATIGSFTIDSTAPGFGDLVVAPGVAKAETTLTIAFDVTELLDEHPGVTVLERAAEFDSFEGGRYTYKFTVEATDAEGSADITIAGSDFAGNLGTATSGSFTIDTTAPSAWANATCALEGTNGWCRGAVMLTGEAADGMSGVDASGLTCTLDGASSPCEITLETDGESAFEVVSTDVAGNANSASKTIHIDRTAPDFGGLVVAPAIANAGTTVTLTFEATEALGERPEVSILERAAEFASIEDGLYTYTFTVEATDAEGPAEVTISSVDFAGNLGTATPGSFTIDSTAPSVWANATCTLEGLNGWCRGPATLTGESTDATAGVDASRPSCTLDGASSPCATTVETDGIFSFEVVSTDVAGNVDSATKTIQIDRTPPVASFVTRTPPANEHGWNDGDVTLRWSCVDAAGASGAVDATVSGVATGEGASLSASATCADAAGNTLEGTESGIRIDRTPPEIILESRSPQAGASGWHTSDVTITWSCTDGLSGSASATTSVHLTTEDEALTATGTCHDLAGNDANLVETGIALDKTPPMLQRVPLPPPNAAGWYAGPVALSWECTDSLSGTTTPTITTLITDEGDDLSSTATCTDAAGHSTMDTLGGIRIDLTPPTLALASHEPIPNAAGWNTGEVTLTWECSDALSGETASVTTESVAQPGIMIVTATCIDLAGNIATDTREIRIDVEPPVLSIELRPEPPQDNDKWLTSPARARIVATDAHSGVRAPSIAWSFDNVTFQSGNELELPEGITVLTAYAADLVGHEHWVTMTTRVDHTPPTVTFPPQTGALAAGQHLVIRFNEAMDVANTTISAPLDWPGVWASDARSYTITVLTVAPGEYEVTVLAGSRDSHGVATPTTASATYVVPSPAPPAPVYFFYPPQPPMPPPPPTTPREPPTVTASLTPERAGGDANYYRTTPRLMLSAREGATIYVRIDTGHEHAYSAPIEFEDGTHVVEFRAVDDAGPGPVIEVTLRVDTRAPTIDTAEVTPSAVDLALDPTPTFEFHIATFDGHSGIASATVEILGPEGDVLVEIPLNGALQGHYAPDRPPTPGTYSTRLTVTDIAGNVAFAEGPLIVLTRSAVEVPLEEQSIEPTPATPTGPGPDSPGSTTTKKPTPGPAPLALFALASIAARFLKRRGQNDTAHPADASLWKE